MELIKNLLTYVLRGQLSKLDALYQRHAGEECYIFGDGVSLKWMDIRRFADKPSILGNMMIYHKEAKALNVPYCTITEPYWFWPFFPYCRGGKLLVDRHFVHEEYRKSINQNPSTLFFINYSNYPVARFPNALYVSRFYRPPFENNNPFRERDDAHRGTFTFQISMAIYLGFRKAYLVGHDYTHTPSRTLHFYEKGEGFLDGSKEFNRDFIDYAKQYVELVTVTLNSGSDTMPHIKYKELTGKEPSFRENVDIVDRVKLQNLATWKGYSIF